MLENKESNSGKVGLETADSWGCAILGICILSAVSIFVYQGYIWFRMGSWLSLPTSKFILPLLPDEILNWLLEPTDWVGVAKVIIWLLDIPFSLMLLIVGFLFFVLGENISESWSKVEFKED